MKSLIYKFRLCVAPFTFLLIMFAAGILAISSCKKSNPTENTNPASDYYVRFKVDGTTIQYTKSAEGTMNVVDGAGRHQCNIAGLKNEFVTDKGTMVIIMTNDDLITTGKTYTNYATASPGYVKARVNQVGRFDDAGVFFASWGDEYASFGVTSDTKVSFTEINDSYIKGNFSATIYKEIDGASEKHFITEGEFKVKRIQ